MVLDYSEHAVVVVDVPIIRVEVGMIVEVVQPRRPPNNVAPDTAIITTISATPVSILSRLSYQV